MTGKEQNMPDKNLQKNFPFKTANNYLEDIELREKIINENLKFITLSRQALQKIMQREETADTGPV